MKRETYDDDNPFESVRCLRVEQFHERRLEGKGVVDSVVESSECRGRASACLRRDEGE